MTQSLPNTILMTTDTVGGVWNYALELSQTLQKFGIQVYLATMGKRLSKNQWQEAEQISNLIIKESSYALEWMNDPWKDVGEAALWLKQLEQQIQPDLIHLNNFAHGSLSWNAPVLVVGHSCVLTWWQAVKREEAPEEWNHYAQRVKEGLQHADYVVAVSDHLLNQLREIYGPFSNSESIYNARDTEDFYSSEKEKVIFSMGRLWDEGKNIRSLSEIAGVISWPVFVAGAGGEDPENKNITHLDHLAQTEVAEWLSKTSIYVMPARYEPFGLSVLEAALSECALVLGDIPTLREIWEDAALYADPENTDELKHQIQTLIHNPSHRKQMAHKARQRARRYSTERFAEKYLKVYQKLISPDSNRTKPLIKKANLNIEQ